MADIGNFDRVGGSIPPPDQARQAPGRRDRDRPAPRRPAPEQRDAAAPDERERHIDEYA
jgi:hypothetical protein